MLLAGMCLLVTCHRAVSCGGDMELCGVDTVVSGAVS